MGRKGGILAIALLAGLACETLPGEREPDLEPRAIETVDGLVYEEIDLPGVLFLREDHRIGGFDELLVPAAWIRYEPGSRRLAPEMEQEFKDLLVQSLVDLARAADIEIVDSPGTCVMEIRIGLLNVDLERSTFAETLGTLTIAMEFRDSTSGEPLLRYATRNEIANRSDQIKTRRRQLREGFDFMLERMNVGTALRGAGLADDELRPGCRGVLAARGRAAVAAEGAR